MKSDDDSAFGDVPDSLAGVPGYPDLFPGEKRLTESHMYVPALSAPLRAELEESLKSLGTTAGRAANAAGDGLRELATAVGVTGPDRLALLEVAMFGSPYLLGRIAFADAARVVDLTADTAPAGLWRTAVTLFEVVDRRLRVRGDRDQGIVWDLDRRLCAARSITAVFRDDGEPVGQMGRWTSVLQSTLWYREPYLEPATTGPAVAEIVERIEALMLRYGLRFVQWPDANPGR